MNADTLRMLLFILGCFFILGIYLWDKYKRISGGKLKIRLDKKRAPWNREAPSFKGAELHQATTGKATVHESPINPIDLPEDSKGAKREVYPTPARNKVRSVRKIRRIDSTNTNDTNNLDQVPEKILQLFIRSKKGSFSGEDVFRAARSAGLRHGEMDIFHYHEDSLEIGDNVIFSVASMINPGTIPIKGMAEFSTPGLAIFARLPGVKDSMKIFQDMLNIAGELSQSLNGDVLDDARQELTESRVQQMRNEIIEHRKSAEVFCGPI